MKVALKKVNSRTLLWTVHVFDNHTKPHCSYTKSNFKLQNTDQNKQIQVKIWGQVHQAEYK